MAAALVIKGSIEPFNRIGLGGGFFGGQKLAEPYRWSPWVMRAIKKVAGPIAAVTLQFTAGKRGSDQLVDDTALESFWEMPAVGMTRADFIEASVGWLKLRGEFFWLLDDRMVAYRNAPFRDVLETEQKFQPLIVARPDRMREVVKDGRLEGWVFMDGQGRPHNLTPEQVIHCKCWNPYDEFRGMAEMDSALPAAEADYLAAKYNLNLMRNNGDQGPYIVAKGAMPTDQQREQIVESLRQKKEMSLLGIFKPMFLTGDITVEDPKVQTPDANFVAVRVQNKKEIFLAFGVPPSMAEPQASYSIGSASDWYTLIFETCIPTAAKIAPCIDRVVKMQMGQPLFSEFNFNEHPVMQEVRRERIDTAVKLFGMGCPLEVANDHLQLGLPEFEGWDVGYLPFGLAPVGENERPAASTNFGEAIGNTEQKNFLGGVWKRPAREKAQWEAHAAKRLPVAKMFERAFHIELFKARMEVLKKLDGTALKGLKKSAATDFLFDLTHFRDGLLASMRKTAAQALQVAGSQLFEEIAKDDPFQVAPREVLEFFHTRENKIVGAADNVFDAIKDSLQEGINDGESIAELSKRVRGSFNDIDEARGKVIAMTETSAAYGTSRDMAMKAAGIKGKRWLTSGNANVRPAHREANGQTVGIEEPFEVGGEELDYPGDPEGSPGNVINCHCVAIPVGAPEES